MKFLLPLVVVLPLVAPAQAASEAQAQQCVAEASATEARALAAQAAWTSTEQVLAAARKALEAKDWDGACKAAIEAKAQAERALEQANEQKSLWRDAVLK